MKKSQVVPRERFVDEKIVLPTFHVRMFLFCFTTESIYDRGFNIKVGNVHMKQRSRKSHMTLELTLQKGWPRTSFKVTSPHQHSKHALGTVTLITKLTTGNASNGRLFYTAMAYFHICSWPRNLAVAHVLILVYTIQSSSFHGHTWRLLQYVCLQQQVPRLSLQQSTERRFPRYTPPGKFTSGQCTVLFRRKVSHFSW